MHVLNKTLKGHIIANPLPYLKPCVNYVPLITFSSIKLTVGDVGYVLSAIINVIFFSKLSHGSFYSKNGP